MPVLPCLRAKPAADTVAIEPIRKAAFQEWLEMAPTAARAWVSSIGFAADPGSSALLPGDDGKLARVLVGVPETLDLWSLAGLPGGLPKGSYRVDAKLSKREATLVATGWALACYQFARYRKTPKEFPQLVLPAGADAAAVERVATAAHLVRDMVNTPAEHMGPQDIARVAKDLAEEFGAKLKVIEGEELLEKNYPMIHAVGRASSRPPLLIDLRWGDKNAPAVTLVGKGVVFDTGGLDIKSSANMLLMKKDMGGAAHALGLARMIMMAGLPVRLRVLVPAVENAVSGNAFRPLDVIPTRKGLHVEIGNTDAEGRLILCDALAEAVEDKPALLVDFATLTGAARVALGPDLPAMFSNDDRLAEDLLAASRAEDDPMWRMPLWQPYRRMLDSKVADINNAPGGTFAGAITAALFLKEFVPDGQPWAHFDLFAWNPSARPGRPEGGEAMTLRAVFAVIRDRVAAAPADAKAGKPGGRKAK